MHVFRALHTHNPALCSWSAPDCANDSILVLRAPYLGRLFHLRPIRWAKNIESGLGTPSHPTVAEKGLSCVSVGSNCELQPFECVCAIMTAALHVWRQYSVQSTQYSTPYRTRAFGPCSMHVTDSGWRHANWDTSHRAVQTLQSEARFRLRQIEHRLIPSQGIASSSFWGYSLMVVESAYGVSRGIAVDKPWAGRRRMVLDASPGPLNDPGYVAQLLAVISAWLTPIVLTALGCPGHRWPEVGMVRASSTPQVSSYSEPQRTVHLTD